MTIGLATAATPWRAGDALIESLGFSVHGNFYGLRLDAFVGGQFKTVVAALTGQHVPVLAR